MHNFIDIQLGALYKKNPILSHFYEILPVTINDCFQWVEFMATTSPSIFGGLRKLSELPITSLTYGDEEGEDEETMVGGWKEILEDELEVIPLLADISYNYSVYGNCFVSVYAPFTRTGKCEKCHSPDSLELVKNLTVSLRSKSASNRNRGREAFAPKSKDVFEKLVDAGAGYKSSPLCFRGECKKCGVTVEFVDIVDAKVSDISKVNVIVWEPHLMSIRANKITGKNIYYYNLDAHSKAEIRKNRLDMITTFPVGLIEASLSSNKMFSFDDGHIYHMKEKTLAGLSTAWGIPVAISALPPFLSMVLLKNANDIIASDYSKPLRIASPPPQQGSGSDMYNFMGGGDFASKMQAILRTWKVDPAAIHTLPFAVNFQTALGEGKLLSLESQIESAERSVAAAIGIPYEFIFGGLSYTAQGASLRLLEVKLANTSKSLDKLLQFIVAKVGKIIDKAPVSVSFIPFNLIDDLQKKATIVNMALQGNGTVSNSTIMDMFNIDSQREKDRLMREKKRDVTEQLELQNFQKEQMASIEQRARDKEQLGKSQFSQLNQQSLMEEAQTTAQQLMQMDHSTRKSQLDQLSKDNYIMYGVVRAILDRASTQREMKNVSR